MDDVYGLDDETRLLKRQLIESMRLGDIRTQVPKLNQCSTYRFNVGWIVANTAMAVEADNPSSEDERAMYLGEAAE